MTALAFDIASLPFAERIHWQSRKDWLSGRVTHSSAIVVAGLWGFSALWWSAIGFIGTVNRHKIMAAVSANWTEATVPAVMVGLGVIVLLCAVGATLSWIRNGQSALILETLPAFTGDLFWGTVEAGDILKAHKDFELTLTCERVTDVRLRQEGSRRRKHAHFARETLGKVTKKLHASPLPAAGGKYSFPVTISVPTYLPGSLHEEDGTGIRWTLHVQSQGAKDTPVFGAAFEVPVYRREDLEVR